MLVKLMLVKLDGKDSQTVVNALIKHSRRLPHELYKSLTWKRGTEMHGHERFTMATDIQFFCDPQSAWQRGSNENTNGLLRQYLPNGLDLSAYSQSQLNSIARQWNERPRKTLGFHTPAERFSACVAATAASCSASCAPTRCGRTCRPPENGFAAAQGSHSTAMANFTSAAASCPLPGQAVSL